MSPKDDGITSAIILQHMQAMEQRIMEKFSKIDDRFAQVDNRFDRLEQKIDRNHVILSTQIANLDERLDDLEVVQVPGLKKAVGM